MKKYFYIPTFTLFILLLLNVRKATAQVVVTSSDSLSCTVTCTTLTATVTGDSPTPSGISIDDIYSAVLPIGFTFTFYSVPYTQVVIGPNGTLCFNTALAGATDPWPITAVLLGNPSKYNNICGPWCDIDISPAPPSSGTITYSLTGIAPFRKYVVTYCNDHMYSCTTQITSTQIILYETTNITECHIATKPICATWNSGHAIIGVQNATGTAATVAPARDFPAAYTCTNEAWRFTPNAAGTAYTVASIAYAPVPYSSSLVYWYNATTGAYLGTGLTQVVCPTTPTLYKAGALGCADTSFGYYLVTPGPTFTITPVGTNPTVCGLCNGSITVGGFTPGMADTLTYMLAGVPQPTVYATASAAGTVTISGLCAGTYSNFIGHQGACATPPAGPVTLTNPPFTITLGSTNPTLCGLCNGTITISGLEPGMADTVNYNRGGVPQPTIYTYASAGGTITLSGLCAGTYDNFIVKQLSCSTPATGPANLIDPPIAISGVLPVSPSICGACDGSLTLAGLYPSHVFTVTYSMNGVPQTPIVTTTNSAGEITIAGLCDGVYSNIVAFFGTCITPAVGPFTLAGPPPPAGSIISFTSPTECGKCNGTIRLKAVTPYSSDTISYLKNGVAQTPIITTAMSDSSILLFGFCAGTYTSFTVKIGHCVTTIFGTATLTDPPLTANFDTTFRLGCKGDSVFFHNHSTSTGALNYVWNFGDGSSDTATNPIHVYPAGTYNVRLLATNGYCTDTTNLVFTVGHPLIATYTLTPTIVCQHDPVTFTNSSTGATNYLWHYGNGVKDTTSNPTYTFNYTGTYKVALIAANNIPCYDTMYAIVQVDTISGMNIKLTDTVLCVGNYITLTGLFSSIGNTGITWNFGDGDSIRDVNPVYHAYTKQGQFTITSNAHYRVCPEAITTRVVNVFQMPTLDIGKDTSICKGSEPIVLKDTYNAGNPLASWTWSTGQKGNSMTIVSPGTYYGRVNINNCYATDSVVVSDGCYIEVPNAFTPNADGINDFFFPRQLLSRGLTAFNMHIYNRWGQLIFESKTLDGSGWDGKMNGIEQPVGVYVYVIEATFKDGQQEKHQGNITLMR